MLKKIGLVMIVGIVLSGCTVNKRAGIEVISQPTAKIFIDNKEAGTTPYKNGYLRPGRTDIKLVADNREWIKTVELVNNVNTVVNLEMGKNEENDGSYVLSMERTGDNQKAGLIVSGLPKEAAVAIEGETKGFLPLKLDDIGEGDQQVTLSYPTYRTQNIFVKAVQGYRLLIETKLAKEEVLPIAVSPTPAETVATTTEIMIKPTETGWLRVRGLPDSGAAEVAKVKPGEKFVALEEKDGWYRIESGWISAKYAEKL